MSAIDMILPWAIAMGGLGKQTTLGKLRFFGRPAPNATA